MYTLASQSASILLALDALGWRSCVCLAHSLGAGPSPRVHTLRSCPAYTYSTYIYPPSSGSDRSSSQWDYDSLRSCCAGRAGSGAGVTRAGTAYAAVVVGAFPERFSACIFLEGKLRRGP
jgi:hypothetical protein